MAHVLVPALSVSPDTLVRKVRELPMMGQTLVKVGEQVKASQEVARAELPGELIILKVPEKMGLHPSEVLSGLRVKEGDTVKEGELLCEHRGLFGLLRTVFISPVDGVVELITARTAHVAVRLAAKPVTINAYIEGKVSEVNSGKSVTVETRASFIQGIFGVGGERQGKLHIMDLPLDHTLEQCPKGVEGAILVGGTDPSAEFLREATTAGVKGLVVGSIDDAALKAYLGYDLGIALTGDEDVPMTVMITEGFGSIGLSEQVYNLLKKHHGLQASINGATQVRAGALRPEVIVSLPGKDAGQEGVKERELSFDINSLIRIIRVPYFGQFGTVLELPHEPERIETGALTRVVKVKLQDGKVVTVPRANVEIVGG